MSDLILVKGKSDGVVSTLRGSVWISATGTTSRDFTPSFPFSRGCEGLTVLKLPSSRTFKLLRTCLR